jgi:transposase InsO family protein
VIYQFIDTHRWDGVEGWSVKKMARVLEVSPSGYYAWRTHRKSERQQMDASLIQEILTVQKEHRYRYGSPRIVRALRPRGFHVGHNRVARLMRSNGLNCCYKKKFIHTTNSQHDEPVAQNLLARQFTVLTPNTVWVSDITYLPTREGWLYLCVILDLFDRKIVGWTMRSDMTAILAIDAFMAAVLSRRPKGSLLFHTDRGVQYCSAEFRRASEELVPRLTRSMSRKGNCWDNACAESFFKTLKREQQGLDGTCTKKEVGLLVFEYLECYYNRIRMHSHLGYRSPVEMSQLDAQLTLQ